ncbi:MAG: two-component regulator propeller domain-containing protein [Acidobacteriota bacterium]
MLIGYRWLLGAILLSTAALPAAAEPAAIPANVRFEHLATEEGLSQNTVYSIAQDRQGFMWFGTKVGLNRYDGYSFKVFSHDPYALDTLSEAFVRVVFEDRDGILWIGTHLGGLNRFDPVTETFTHYRHRPDDVTSLSDDDVRAITQDRSGNLWIGTQGGGLNRFHPETGSFTRYQRRDDDPTALSHDDVRAIVEDQAGNLWIGTYGGGLNRLIADAGDGQAGDAPVRFAHYRERPQDPTSLVDNRIRALAVDGEGRLWIGTNDGLARLDATSETFSQFRHDAARSDSLSDNRVRSLFRDSAGRLWIGTRFGLNLYLPETGTFRGFTSRSEDPYSLSGESAYSIFEDQAGSLWIGTYNGGVNRLDPTAETFSQFRHEPGNPNSVSADEVSALHVAPSGTLWIGTYGGGLDRFDLASRSFRNYHNDRSDPGSLSDNRVASILEDRSGQLWVGMYNNGLSRLRADGERFVHYRHDPQDATSLSRDYVRALYQDRSGALWIGTQGGGLERFDPATETFVHHRNDPQDPSSLSHDSVFAILEDRAGSLWVGTYGGGLNRFDAERTGFTRYRHDPEVASSLRHDAVSSLHEDRAGRLWVGTFGGGLERFDPATETFSHMRGGVEDLPGNTVLGILEDQLGRLWLSTNRGLIRFDPAADSWTSYDVRDGLQDVEFNHGSYSLGPDGTMYFGGNSGFNAFQPERFVDNAFEPPVVLTSFKIFEQAVPNERGSSYLEEIELSYHDNFFSFEFAALSFRRPDKNRYRYMLEGLDEDWIDPGTRRYASYTKVPPGNYVFRVQGSNNDGRWNAEGASVQIAVTPPLWKTPAFIALQILLAAGLIYSAFVAQRRRLKRQETAALQRLDLQRKRQELASAEQWARELESKNRELEATQQQILETQAQLIQSEKLASIGQLVAGVAHEINNPVSFISSGLPALRRDVDQLGTMVPEERRDARFEKIHGRILTLVDVIAEGARRTTEIIKSLRTFSRQDEAKLGVIDLNASLDDTLNLLQNLTKNRIRVVKHYGELPDVQCYGSQLNQVFMNLLVNSIQAIEGSGTITVTTETVAVEKRDATHVAVTIRDTGRGMTEAVQKKIFDPFFTTKPVGEGTGLGLSISHGILEQHRATLELESTPDVGTEFRIILPTLQLTDTDSGAQRTPQSRQSQVSSVSADA